MITINEQPFERRYLSEGRDHGLGFSICKLLSDNTYQPLIPLTACKDYLNDIAHIEQYDTVNGKIYGFEYEYSDYFQNSDLCFMQIGAVHYNCGSEYSGFDDIHRFITKNIGNLIGVLNYFEDRLNIKRTTYDFATNYEGEEVVLLTFDRFWMKDTFLISLYTLLIRFYMNFKYKVISRKRLMKHKPYLFEDIYIFTDIIKKNVIYNFKKFKVYKDFTHKISLEHSSIGCVHNYGIKAFHGNTFTSNKFYKI